MFTETIENFKQLVLKDGFNGNVNDLFKKAEKEHLSYVTNLFGTFAYWSGVYKHEDGELDELKSIKVPDIVIEFFKQCEPHELPCLPCYLNLFDLETIRNEHMYSHPSAYLIKYGLLTIGSTIGGNVVAMDLNTYQERGPKVIYIDRCWISFNEMSREVEVSFKANELAHVLRKNLISRFPVIAPTFLDFIHNLSVNTYPDIEEYYEKV